MKKIFVLSLAWWLYLAAATQMQISADAIDYQENGRLIQQHGFLPAYVEGGPRREPLYPLLVAGTMHLESFRQVSYTKIMAVAGVLILALSQFLLFVILQRLKVSTVLSAAVLLYFAFSPAITNSAFSLFSEIITYPLVLGVVLASTILWEKIQKANTAAAVGLGVLLGAVFAGLTFSKGVFECVFPLYTAGILVALWIKHGRLKSRLSAIACVLSALAVFYIPVNAYKQLSLKHNGIFSITSRWPWMVYGSSTQRTQPSNWQHLPSALAYVPGEGLCNGLLGSEECSRWSFTQTDAAGIKKLAELKSSGLSAPAVNAALAQEAVKNIAARPVEYVFFTLLEAVKPFFWESTQIGFVSYPQWLAHLYDNRWFNNGLRLITALLTVIGVVFVWRNPLSSPVSFSAGLIIILFIMCISFVTVLTRYALPIAPLYLICIACAANSLYTKRHARTTH